MYNDTLAVVHKNSFYIKKKGNQTMIEKIKGLSIQGRCFPVETKLNFYPSEADRISIVYGRNGSGKSTISTAFSSIASGEPLADVSAHLFDKSKSTITLSQDCKIYVFNEDYIDQNVKINDDGLGTIILLGGQVDLQSEIDHYIEMESRAYTEKESAQKRLEQFDDPKNPNSPNFHYDRIKKSLQAGWSTRDSAIKGSKTASKVTAAVIKEICELSVSETAPQLQKKFDDAKKLLEKVSDTTANFPTPILTIAIAAGFENKLCALLSKQINKPNLTEREKEILALVQSGKQSTIEQARDDFSKEDTQICPYCFRPIDNYYKHELIESINRVFNKDVDVHKRELSTVIFPDFSSDYSMFAELDAELVSEILVQQKKCFKIVARYQEALQTKVDNIYTPLFLEALGIESAIDDLNRLLITLESERQEFIDATKRKKRLEKELIDINKRIAHVQIEPEYRDYQKQCLLQRKAIDVFEKAQGAYATILEKRKELEQKKSNVGLAIKSINNALDYVFFSHGRLSIELKNNRYYLKSNGNDVKPKNVSLGERNIIALCYFFTEILSNQDITKLYQSEELIVIDDPVSSFDFENKVGISSFLRYQASQIIKGNKNSRIMLLTHDLSTLFDFQKIIDEVNRESGGDNRKKVVRGVCFELIHRQLEPFKGSFNEYREMLKSIYEYAIEKVHSLDLTIGNIMRRTLEAFSTFMYGTGISEVSFNSNALKSLGSHASYFENLMYRLVLNGESHFVDRIYGVKDEFRFFDFISSDEKQRTCKDILCFMYALSPDHVISYLPDNAISNIRNWLSAIPANEDFEILLEPITKVVHLYDFPLSAGHGDEIFDDDATYEDYETDNKECDFALRVSGDSMEPMIMDGSIVLIKESNILLEGEIGAFYLNGKVYCKKLIYKRGVPCLRSENSKYSLIEVQEHDVFKPYGKVIEIIN